MKCKDGRIEALRERLATGVETPLVCLNSLMERDGENYSAVLGLLRPILDELQEVEMRMWEVGQGRERRRTVRSTPDV